MAAHAVLRVRAGVVCGLCTLAILQVLAPRAHAATVLLKAGADLQAALNAAQPGDEIVLEAGVTFTGAFVLPAKPQGPVIVVRSSATLPNRRITPADDALLPRIRSGSVAPAIYCSGSQNWRFDGIRLLPTHEGHYNVVFFEEKVTATTACRNVTFDRILFQGDTTFGQRRVFAVNGANVRITRSYLHNIFRQGDESNCVGAWVGPGPLVFDDNFCEAAGINILIGGADSPSPDMIVSDVLVEKNHFTKRLEWKQGGARPATVKNLFEVKSGKRITVRDNRFERNWTDAQNGFAILFTVSNDGGNSPWTTIEDVLFERNTVRDVERGININGHGYQDWRYPTCCSTLQARRIVIRNNLLGSGFQIGGEAGEVTFDHNTFIGQGVGTLYRGGIWHSGEQPRDGRYAVASFTFTNNLAYHGDSGLFGDGVGIGMPALTNHTLSYAWTHNALAGESGFGYSYPPITWQPTLADHNAQFKPDYTLTDTSAYRRAGNDGKDLGWLTASSSTPAPPPEVCGDGVDNDADGAIDEGCPASPPPPSEVCGDGRDNDGDGAIDEGCPAPTPASEVCGDGKDNDGDGKIDEDCAPPPPADIEGPVVTLWNVVQRANQYKFRIEATDASAITNVRVELDSLLVASGTKVPLEVTIPLRKVSEGAHALQITVTDAAGNSTALSRTIMVTGTTSSRR